MGHDRVEVFFRAKVSSNVPAAPWEPTTVTTRSRAAQATPAGIDDVVVADVEVLPVDAVAPVVVVVPDWGDEHAASPTAPSAIATTMAGRARRVPRAVVLGRVGCGVEVLRS